MVSTSCSPSLPKTALMPENFSESNGMFTPSLDGGQVAKEDQKTAKEWRMPKGWGRDRERRQSLLPQNLRAWFCLDPHSYGFRHKQQDTTSLVMSRIVWSFCK